MNKGLLIKFTTQSKRDFKNIGLYTKKKWGKNQKDTYLNQIYQQIQNISINPNIGKSRSDIGKNLKSIPEGKHLIFYRATKDDIQIIRILHESMDFINKEIL